MGSEKKEGVKKIIQTVKQNKQHSGGKKTFKYTSLYEKDKADLQSRILTSSIYYLQLPHKDSA